MKCKICGAKLKKEDGDICTNCYKRYQEEEDLKKDTNVIYEFGRSHNVGCEIMRYTPLYFIFILSILMIIASKEWLTAILTIIGFFALIFVLFYIDRKFAEGTTVTCYETKMVCRKKAFFFDSETVVKYENIGDVTYYQRFPQKKFGMGDICVYAKGPLNIPTLFNGFQVKNVEEVSEVLQILGEIIGPLE